MFYTIIGTQWGDEGKGKIVDWLASKVDIVVRFQGGNNAGHTLQIGNNIYKLNLNSFWCCKRKNRYYWKWCSS